jgi:two-component system cell cycle response regulator DivK
MSRSILVVEDNSLVTELYRSCLKPLDCDIVHARTGDQALDLSLLEGPDLIIMDIMLPGLSGFDVMQRFRTRVQTCTTPAIAVTVPIEDDDVMRMERAGFNAWLTKPISVPHFIATVRNFLP